MNDDKAKSLFELLLDKNLDLALKKALFENALHDPDFLITEADATVFTYHLEKIASDGAVTELMSTKCHSVYHKISQYSENEPKIVMLEQIIKSDYKDDGYIEINKCIRNMEVDCALLMLKTLIMQSFVNR